MGMYTAHARRQQEQKVQAPPNRSRDAAFLDPSQAILTSAVARFHTNSDDKDWDTKLTITIEKGPDQFAKVQDIVGGFPDHSDTGPFGLQIQGVNSKADLRGATTTLQIVAVNDDTWQFNYFLELTYSDGSVQEFRWFNSQLTEQQNFKTFPL